MRLSGFVGMLCKKIALTNEKTPTPNTYSCTYILKYLPLIFRDIWQRFILLAGHSCREGAGER